MWNTCFVSGLAQMLGDITATYRWFAGVYLAVMFVFAPLFIFILSMAGTQIMYGVLGPLMAIGLVVILINVVQNYRVQWLPYFIRDWSFLPLWMRSLKPLDDFFQQLTCCSKCINPQLESIQMPDLRDVESAIMFNKELHSPHNIHKEEMKTLFSSNAATVEDEKKIEMEAQV